MVGDTDAYQRLRLRVTGAATAVVLVVLVASAWAVTTSHRRVLVANLGEVLDRAVDDLAADLPSRGDGVAAPAIVGFGDDDAAYQIVVDGEVVAASSNLEGDEPIAPAPRGAATVRTVSALPHDTAPFLVRSEAVASATGSTTVVHVAAPLDDIDESAASLRRAMLVAVAATASVLGVALWALVGRLLASAEAAAARQARFVADASHELRGPLTRMRTELEVDLAHPGAADPTATHRLVLDEVVGMQDLVADMLVAARGPTTGSGGGGSAAAVALDELVQQVVAGLPTSADVAVQTDTEPVVVRGRRAELGRVVWNLADNAVRHASSSVRIEVRRRGGEAVLSVTDDGPGIAAADRERVFDRFARLDDARGAATGGSGLGLAIVRQIAEDHGGRVSVDAGHSPGARLEVVLPAVGAR